MTFGKTGQMMGKIVAFLAVMMVMLSANMAAAGPIERACNSSDRKAASNVLCNCIQQVANMVLPNADQRRAAKLLTNPDKAHATWMSKSSGDDAFWDRYKQFGQYAEQYCAPSS